MAHPRALVLQRGGDSTRLPCGVQPHSMQSWKIKLEWRKCFAVNLCKLRSIVEGVIFVEGKRLFSGVNVMMDLQYKRIRLLTMEISS